MGEDLGEGFARRVRINESTTLSPSPSPTERGVRAFTLAEVLITLVIIGIIAAITVPSLINKTQNQEFVSKLKKTYSTLSQATNQIIAEEGIPNSVDAWTEDSSKIYRLYKKHLINAKDCGEVSGCASQMQNNNYKFLDNRNVDSAWNFDTQSFRQKLVLSDGVQIIIDSSHSICSASYYGTDNCCAWIWVDINGEKRPNTVGRDLFIFAIKKQGLYPAGCDTGRSCPYGTGVDCTCKVLREGAMNY